MAQSLDLDLERAGYLWMEKCLTWDFLDFLNESNRKREAILTSLKPVPTSPTRKKHSSWGILGVEGQLGLAHLN